MANYKGKKYTPNKSVVDRSKIGGFKDIVRSALGQGLAFGFGDEVEAFTRSLASDKDYDDIVEEIRAEIELFRKEKPALAYGSEIAGGVLTGGLGIGRTALGTAGRSALTGGAYGVGMAEGPVEERLKSGAVSAGLSGIAGPVLQKVLPTKTPQAKELMEEGVELTPGQAMGGAEGSVIGKGLQRLEETATSIPMLGTGEALQRSKETFNMAVYNRALDKIGYQMPKNINIDDAPKVFQKTILDRLNQTVSTLKVKNIPELQQNINNVLLDSPLTKTEIKAINNKLNKMIFEKSKRKTVSGQLAGKDLQKADSYLNKQARNYSTSTDAAQREIGDVYSDIYSVFSDHLIKNNPQSIVKNYKNAKNAYADLLTISKAGTVAAGDSVFTPKQLLRQSRALDPTSAKRKSFIGEGRLQDIGRLGEDVIGKGVPESGTTGRMLTASAALGGLGAVDPLSAAIASMTLGSYQSPLTQRLLLESLSSGSQAAQRAAPLVTTELANPLIK